MKNYNYFLVAVLCLAFSLTAVAQGFDRKHPSTWPINKFSATRLPGESAGQAYKRFLSRLGQSNEAPTGQLTPVNAAVPISMLNFSHVPQWANPNFAMGMFTKIRDARFIQDPEHAGNLRRSSWLFPDDGCFARAALMGQNLEKLQAPVPMKLFIFGNLVVKTANSPAGNVRWWYHVVPVVMVGQQPIILDPAIDPSHPLTLKNWVMTMTNDPNSVKVALCSPHTYAPSSPCPNAGKDDDARAMNDQKVYLSYEWARVTELHRDPVRELGDFPPWLHSAFVNMGVYQR